MIKSFKSSQHTEPSPVLRFYEKQGLFRPRRKENNYRDYSPEDVTALKEIMVYRKMGFTVEEVALILKRQLPYREGVISQV